MAAPFKIESRSVIPRWRDFASTVKLGELSEASSRRAVVSEKTGGLETLEEDWKVGRTLSFAGDLLSAALSRGASELTHEAARFVLETQGETSPGHPLTRIAQRILTTHRAIPSPNETQISARSLISLHRRSLNESPRNGILWVDLSLLYAAHGLSDKARRAMQVALSLEPENRFILRSAARLFIHLNEPDRAHRLLRRSALSKFDPWIVAAEIATSTAARLISFSIDDGFRILAKSGFGPADTTELSAAIATLELREGSARKAKQHLRSGLRKPNENSLAQAKWLSRELNIFPDGLSVTAFNVERSYEALTWEAFLKRDWESAAKHALSWFRDESFSSRPAHIAANLFSALLEDYDSAEQLAKLGLIANPHNHWIHIGLVFTYASANRTEEARRQLTQIHGLIEKPVEVAIIANHGLISFRELDYSRGRVFYEGAVAKAREASPELEAEALVYWAREEVRAKTRNSAAILGRASVAVRKVASTLVQAAFVLERIEKEFENSQLGLTATPNSHAEGDTNAAPNSSSDLRPVVESLRRDLGS